MATRSTHLLRTAPLALTALATVLAVLTAAPATAEDLEGARFSGQILLGYRSVDVDGEERTYRRDLNLDDGPRLFSFGLDLVPPENMRHLVDRVVLDLGNLGGDPFETFHLAARKHGRYAFTWDRRESDYFYSDLLGSADGAHPDFHTFDLRRVQDRAKLDLDLTERARLVFSFDRFDRRGESTTTLDISRDEFEFDKPVHETMDTTTVAFSYAWDRVTLVLDETVRDFENLVELFLPGAAIGEDPDDAAVLDFFFLDQPYDFTSREHTVRVTARPTDRFEIRGAASLHDLDLDVRSEESVQGTAFTGAPFSGVTRGSGGIDRDVELYDLELTYLFTARFGVIGSAYRRSLDQDGAFDLVGFESAENRGFWEVETTGLEAGLQLYLTRDFSITGGAIFESRDVDHGFATDGVIGELERTTTDHDGFFLSAAWRPKSGFDLSVRLEDSSYDDPFALASPSDRTRYRVRASYDFGNGLALSGSHALTEYENRVTGWDAEDTKTTARLAYHAGAFDVSLGYALVDADRAILQAVRGGGRVEEFDILYTADADVLDARLRWRAGDRVTAGASALVYSNRGSFALDRDDFRAFVEIDCGAGYLASVGFRAIDYDESRFDFDDYDARVLELGIGYRW